MSLWLVFAFDQFYPQGGGADLRGVFDNVNGAYDLANDLRAKGWDTVQVLNVNPLTYVNALTYVCRY